MNKKIIIIVVVIILLGVGCYFLYENIAHPTYNEGTYVVGKNITPGTYERTGSAYVLDGGMISAGEKLIISNDPGAKVIIKSGTLKFINDKTSLN